MQEKEEIIEGVGAPSLWRRALGYLFYLLIVLGLGAYIGFLLFGDNSLEVYYRLKVQEKSLKRSVEFFKKENARLQKEYFELKDLEVQE